MLVSHFMEEAERLCDRVALIDKGRVVVQDTPAGLAQRVEVAQRIQFRPSAPVSDALLTSVPGSPTSSAGAMSSWSAAPATC